jgi:DNA-directed RNA polymerase specialized sigma24 family protein
VVVPRRRRCPQERIKVAAEEQRLAEEAAAAAEAAAAEAALREQKEQEMEVMLAELEKEVRAAFTDSTPTSLVESRLR